MNIEANWDINYYLLPCLVRRCTLLCTHWLSLELQILTEGCHYCSPSTGCTALSTACVLPSTALYSTASTQQATGNITIIEVMSSRQYTIIAFLSSSLHFKVFLLTLYFRIFRLKNVVVVVINKIEKISTYLERK